jgi:hypothetical protein
MLVALQGAIKLITGISIMTDSIESISQSSPFPHAVIVDTPSIGPTSAENAKQETMPPASVGCAPYDLREGLEDGLWRRESRNDLVEAYEMCLKEKYTLRHDKFKLNQKLRSIRKKCERQSHYGAYRHDVTPKDQRHPAMKNWDEMWCETCEHRFYRKPKRYVAK